MCGVLRDFVDARTRQSALRPRTQQSALRRKGSAWGLGSSPHIRDPPAGKHYEWERTEQYVLWTNVVCLILDRGGGVAGDTCHAGYVYSETRRRVRGFGK